MIELPEFVWSDIERTLEEGFDFKLGELSVVGRERRRMAIDRAIEIVDLERARQVRESMLPSRPKETPNANKA